MPVVSALVLLIYFLASNTKHRTGIFLIFNLCFSFSNPFYNLWLRNTMVGDNLFHNFLIIFLNHVDVNLLTYPFDDKPGQFNDYFKLFFNHCYLSLFWCSLLQDSMSCGFHKFITGKMPIRENLDKSVSSHKLASVFKINFCSTFFSH